MQNQTAAVVYLPLTRRVRLVRAFALLVRALPGQRATPTRHDVPDYLRRDLGLPHEAVGRGSVDPPVTGRTLLF